MEIKIKAEEIAKQIKAEPKPIETCNKFILALLQEFYNNEADKPKGSYHPYISAKSEAKKGDIRTEQGKTMLNIGKD